MLSKLSLFLITAVVLLVVRRVTYFYGQLRVVKASNIPYVIVPAKSFNRVLEITRGLWFPLLDRLPVSWKGNWFFVLEKNSLWNGNYNLFKRVGSDSFLTLALSGKTELFTADPGVISQISNRKTDFPKPLQMYKLLEVFGTNVVTTEGHAWRRHRKVVGPPFTEKNNHLVWDESIYQAQAVLDHLLYKDMSGSSSIKDLDPFMSYVALGVISKAGYGVRLGWKDEEGKTKYFSKEHEAASNNPMIGADFIEGKTHGHKRSFGDTIYLLTRDLLLVLLLPEILLKYLPFERPQSAGETYKDWMSYMKTMLFAKRKEMDSIEGESKDHDLLTILVRNLKNSTNLVERSPEVKKEGSADDEDDDENVSAKLSDDEILGNAFILMIAGHETTAGVLQHALLAMAADPPIQRRLQADIDDIFGGRPPSEWDYERDFPHVFGGMGGAIMAEVLRVMPPVMAIPKWNIKPQTLTLSEDSNDDDNKNKGARSGTVPPRTEIHLVLAGVHRNPKHWPHGKPNPDALQFAGRDGIDPDTDLGEFKPQRWLDHDQHEDGVGGDDQEGKKKANTDRMPADGKKTAETEELGINQAADNAASLYRPPRGAYLPFSEGFRSCMGRRFSQVEVMAVLAVIFQRYSVELAVDQWATDDEVDAMGPAQKKEVWTKAKRSVREGFANGMENRITLKMRDHDVPMRFVKRGSERFSF